MTNDVEARTRARMEERQRAYHAAPARAPLPRPAPAPARPSPGHRDHARVAFASGIALLLVQALGVLVNAAASGQVGVPAAWQPFLLLLVPAVAYLVHWATVTLGKPSS